MLKLTNTFNSADIKELDEVKRLLKSSDLESNLLGHKLLLSNKVYRKSYPSRLRPTISENTLTYVVKYYNQLCKAKKAKAHNFRDCELDLAKEKVIRYIDKLLNGVLNYYVKYNYKPLDSKRYQITKNA